MIVRLKSTQSTYYWLRWVRHHPLSSRIASFCITVLISLTPKSKLELDFLDSFLWDDILRANPQDKTQQDHIKIKIPNARNVFLLGASARPCDKEIYFQVEWRKRSHRKRQTVVWSNGYNLPNVELVCLLVTSSIKTAIKIQSLRPLARTITAPSIIWRSHPSPLFLPPTPLLQPPLCSRRRSAWPSCLQLPVSCWMPSQSHHDHGDHSRGPNNISSASAAITVTYICWSQPSCGGSGQKCKLL